MIANHMSALIDINERMAVEMVERKYFMSWTGKMCAYDNGILMLNDAFEDHINFIVCEIVNENVMLKIVDSLSEKYVLDVHEDGSVILGNEPKLFNLIDNGDNTFSISISGRFLSAGRNKRIALAERNLGWERWRKIDTFTGNKYYSDIAKVYRDEMQKMRRELDLVGGGPYRSACVNHSLSYIYSRTDNVIGRSMTNSGENYSRKLIEAFFELTEKYYYRKKRTGVFFDIGANIGTTSIYVKKILNPDLRVIGIEVGEENYRVCKANCILNGADEIEVIHVGLGESKGVEKYFYASGNPGASRIVKSEEGIGDVEKVNIMRFEDLCSEMGISSGDIDYIWMDTEGFESKIIAGGMNVLSSGSIPLLQEFNPGDYDDWERYKFNMGKCYSRFIDMEEYILNKWNYKEYEISDLDAHKEKVLKRRWRQGDLFWFN